MNFSTSEKATISSNLFRISDLVIHDQYLGLEMGSHGKCQAHVHPARIPLHRRVNELLHLGKSDYFIQPLPNFGFGHPKDRAIKKDVLSSRELRMKSGSNF